MFFNSKCFKSCIQWISAFGVFLLMTQVGIGIGWVAPNIVKLTSNDSDIPLDDNQVSWIVSLSPLGAVGGALIGSMCNELFGSRISILLTFLFMAINWVCVIIASSVLWLYLARTFMGISMSMSYCCFALYLGEIADPKVRGTLVSIAAGGNPFGVVMGTIMETYLPMKVCSGIYLAIAVLGLALFVWLRDSSYRLVRKEKYKEAKYSIKFYHPNSDIECEFKEVKSFVESHVDDSFRDKLRDMNTPTIRKALIIIIILFALPHLSGYPIMASYIGVIIEKGKSYLIDSEQFIIYANVMGVVSTLFTFKLIDILGKRVLLIISSTGASMAMVGLGMHFLLLKNGVDPENLQWLPIVCILGYLIFYAIGYSTVPSAVLGELFTDNIKSVAALVAVLFSAFCSFVFSKMFLTLNEMIGETYVFWIHAALGCISIPYALFMLPETKGKTFQEIQDDLIKR